MQSNARNESGLKSLNLVKAVTAVTFQQIGTFQELTDFQD